MIDIKDAAAALHRAGFSVKETTDIIMDGPEAVKAAIKASSEEWHGLSPRPCDTCIDRTNPNRCVSLSCPLYKEWFGREWRALQVLFGVRRVTSAKATADGKSKCFASREPTSVREREDIVRTLNAQGLNNGEIARRTGLSVSTVYSIGKRIGAPSPLTKEDK